MVLGSYFLAQSDPRKDGDKSTKPAGECLHRIRAVRSCPVHDLVFETMVRTCLKPCLSVGLQCMQAYFSGQDMESMLHSMHCGCSDNVMLKDVWQTCFQNYASCVLVAYGALACWDLADKHLPLCVHNALLHVGQGRAMKARLGRRQPQNPARAPKRQLPPSSTYNSSSSLHGFVLSPLA